MAEIKRVYKYLISYFQITVINWHWILRVSPWQENELRVGMYVDVVFDCVLVFL